MADPSKYHPAVVGTRRDLGDDLWIVRVETSAPFSFRPGQYATIGVEREGRIMERPYSICSSPDEPGLELFIELVPDGLLTPHLHLLPEGSEVVVRKRAKGLFLREAPALGHHHLMVATVTGVAPFVSMLRVLVHRYREGGFSPDRDFWLLHGASRSSEFGYLEEMRALDAELPFFHYVPTVSRPWEDPGWTGETGRVEDVLRKYADAAGLAPGDGHVYLCGHPGMIATARAIMRRRGLDDASIREEQYWPEGQTAADKLD
jgi:ferredoxin/flavodoxin---NADP+ reductase